MQDKAQREQELALQEPKVGFLVLARSAFRALAAEPRGLCTHLQHLIHAKSSSVAAESLAGQAPRSFVMPTAALTASEWHLLDPGRRQLKCMGKDFHF